MKVLILTEGGRGIGFGHISRCVAIAQGVRMRGGNATLVINRDNSAEAILRREKLQYVVLDWVNNKKEVLSLALKKSLIIIDSYLAGPNFYDFISRSWPQSYIVAIDDYNRADYHVDAVINPSIEGDKIQYKKSSRVQYLLGKEYIILRKGFWKIPGKSIKKEIKDVLITFGGAHQGACLKKLLLFLKDKFPRYRYHVIGASSLNLKFSKNIFEYPIVSTKEMVDLMLKTDITISGCGQTLYELARIGVPTIGVRFSQNQIVNSKGFQRNGFLENSFYYKDRNLLSNVEKAMNILRNNRVRKKKAIIGRNLVDGKGVKRIMLKLEDGIKYLPENVMLRRADKNDSLDLLFWRNHPDVRKWCFNTNEIDITEHERWFAKTVMDRTTRLYIAQNDEGEKLGQVRFDMVNKPVAFISINLNPRFFNKGFGSKVLIMATRILGKEEPIVRKILAIIMSGNIPSQKAFQKAGYILSRKTIKQGKHFSVLQYEY